MYAEYLRSGVLLSHEEFDKESVSVKGNFEWSDRRLVKFMLENYSLLPITTDSHFGEYLSWAWDVVDHRSILDFYDYYRVSLTKEVKYEIELKTSERVVPIIDGLLTDAGYEESAVNVPVSYTHLTLPTKRIV